MEGSDAPTARPRYARLDVLRALAAIAVMTFHFQSEQMWDAGPLGPVVEHGARGVFVFFVLSGFLVFRPFVAGPVGTWGYALKRMLRIMPAYLVALVLVTLLTGDPLLRQRPLEFLLLLQNYDFSLFQEIVPTAWTLVLEMQFYLLLPLAALGLVPLIRRRPALAVALLVAVGLLSMFLRMWAYMVPSMEPGVIVSVSLPALLWAFVPGMLLAQLMVTRPGVAARVATGPVALLAAGLIAVGWMTSGSPMLNAVAEVSLTMGVALLIPWLIRARTHEARPLRTLAWFGSVASYPFYLWHRTVMDEVRPLQLPGPAAWIVVLLATTIVGTISYRIVERPAMRLATRLADGRNPVATLRSWVSARQRGPQPGATAPTDG